MDWGYLSRIFLWFAPAHKGSFWGHDGGVPEALNLQESVLSAKHWSEIHGSPNKHARYNENYSQVSISPLASFILNNQLTTEGPVVIPAADLRWVIAPW